MPLQFMVPPAELESAAFCSASKRSVQLSYEGSISVLRIIIYPSGIKPSRIVQIIFETRSFLGKDIFCMVS